MTTLSVVIPAYNEEKSIGPIVERVLAVRPALAQAHVSDLDLIVVDDGCRDETASVVRRYPGVRLVQHSTNHGYGAALKTGFSQARGELLGFLDADGTYPPEYFPALCQAAADHGADLVVGSRMAGSDSEMPLTRRVGNTFFAALVTLVGNQRVSDSASGMRVMRRDVLSCLYPLPDGLNFTPVMTTRAIHEQLKIVEVPIPYSERVGRSKLSVVRDGTRFLQSIVWTAMSYNPARILGALGFLAVMLAVLVAMTIPLFGVRGGVHEWPAFRLFVILVLVVGGVNLFSVGTLFNYLVSLFQQRPTPPEKQGLFGRPIFRRPLQEQFIWFGLASLAGGALFCGLALWEGLILPPSPLYSFYLLTSGMLILTGLQLILSWLVVLVLRELTRRAGLVEADLRGRDCAG